MDELLKDFLTETAEHIEGAEQQILQFEKEPSNAALIASVFRLVHTIKGTCSFLGLQRLQRVAHAAETVMGLIRDGATPTQGTISLILSAIDRIKSILHEISSHGAESPGDDGDVVGALELAARAFEEPVRAEGELPEAVAKPANGPTAAAPSSKATLKEETPPKNAETIRVAVDTIESIMQLVSELVLTRNQLLELTRRQENDTIKGPLQRLSSLTTDLQDAVMRARMQPVGRLYSNLPRLVRELSSELKKKLTLVTDGADTEIDRQLIEVIRDPLTHLIRNCADHGIEAPETRVALGKPEAGEIRVSASHEAGQITIKVSDDGRGLHPEKIASRVISNGLASPEDVRNLSQDELFKFIFEPGFSTADVVSNVSGRGVGMDVVRSNIESIGGTAAVSSVAGRGTVFTLKIPLTLAIAPALIIESSGQRFALPQHSVVEVVALGGDAPHKLQKVQNALILKLREEVIPAVELSDILGLDTTNSSEVLAVIMKVGSMLFAIIVDNVLDVQEIVVKPLSASIAHLNVFSGRTILGDGSVVLILDNGGIATRIGIQQTVEKKRDTAHRTGDTSHAMKLVLFRAGDGALKALPLSVVARIEDVDPASLSTVNGRLVMLRQGRLVPIVEVSNWHSSGPSRAMLVIGQGAQAAGLLVEQVVDIIEDTLDMQMESSQQDCIGAAQVRGQAVELLDVEYYLSIAREGMHPVETRGSFAIISDNAVFRDTLAPMLTASGYGVVIWDISSPEIPTKSELSSFDGALVDLEMSTVRRRICTEVLSVEGYIDRQILGIYTKRSAGPIEAWLPTGSLASISERTKILNILAHVVDENRERKIVLAGEELAA